MALMFCSIIIMFLGLYSKYIINTFMIPQACIYEIRVCLPSISAMLINYLN